MGSELAFEVLGIALETTRGDDVTPPTHLLNMTGSITPMHDMIDIQDQAGNLAGAEREEIAHISSEWEAEGAADVTKLPLLGNMVLAPLAAGVASGGEVTGTASLVGGTGYVPAAGTFNITVGAPAAGGRQAVIQATTVGGIITALTVLDPGSHYTSAPTLTFTGHTGTGASATATIQATATTAALWEFVRVMASDTIESATLYWGDPNVVLYKAVYGMANELTLSSDASGTDGATASVSGVAQGASELTGGSIPAIPAIAVGPLLPGGAMQLWMEPNTTAAFGTTAVTGRVISAEWTCPTGLKPKYVAVGPTGGLTFDHVGREKVRPEATVAFELTDTTQTALFIAGTSVKMRVRFNGRTLIEAGFYPFVEFDIQGMLRDLSWGELEGTNRTVEFKIMGVRSSQISSDARMRVQNSSTAL